MGRWSLWRNAPVVLAYNLVVDLTALVLAAVLVRVETVDRHDLLVLGLLAAGSALHVEATRYVERVREVRADGRLHIDLRALWDFAGVLLLPLGLALALIAFSFLHWWLRISRPPVLHRWLFSWATVVLASIAAWAVLYAAGGPDRGDYGGAVWMAVVSVAALVRWGVQLGLVAGAISLTTPTMPWRRRLGRCSDAVLGLAAIALGVVLSQLVHTPWLMPVLLLPLVTMHRIFSLQQLTRAAAVDTKTGLATVASWRSGALDEVARARRRRWGIGVLMVDVDHFKRVNDRHGHLVGDQVLRAVAEDLRSQVRMQDAVGRFGGEEFVVLLGDLQPDDAEDRATAAAERLRRSVSRLEIPVHTAEGTECLRGLTVSIGAAVYPGSGAELHDLLVAADAALYAAKRGGRDQVRCAPRPGAAASEDPPSARLPALSSPLSSPLPAPTPSPLSGPLPGPLPGLPLGGPDAEPSAPRAT